MVLVVGYFTALDSILTLNRHNADIPDLFTDYVILPQEKVQGKIWGWWENRIASSGEKKQMAGAVGRTGKAAATGEGKKAIRTMTYHVVIDKDEREIWGAYDFPEDAEKALKKAKKKFPNVNWVIEISET